MVGQFRPAILAALTERERESDALQSVFCAMFRTSPDKEDRGETRRQVTTAFAGSLSLTGGRGERCGMDKLNTVFRVSAPSEEQRSTSFIDGLLEWPVGYSDETVEKWRSKTDERQATR